VQERTGATGGHACNELTRNTRETDRETRGSGCRALGMMAGGIAHDFNNSLTMISATANCCTVAGGAWLETQSPNLDHSWPPRRMTSHVVSRLREFSARRRPTEIPVPVDLTGRGGRVIR